MAFPHWHADPLIPSPEKHPPPFPIFLPPLNLDVHCVTSSSWSSILKLRIPLRSAYKDTHALPSQQQNRFMQEAIAQVCICPPRCCFSWSNKIHHDLIFITAWFGASLDVCSQPVPNSHYASENVHTLLPADFLNTDNLLYELATEFSTKPWLALLCDDCVCVSVFSSQLDFTLHRKDTSVSSLLGKYFLTSW